MHYIRLGPSFNLASIGRSKGPWYAFWSAYGLMNAKTDTCHDAISRGIFRQVLVVKAIEKRATWGKKPTGY
jgi:hypothetical protein